MISRTRIAPTIVFMLIISLLSGCGTETIVQPSRNDIVGANFFWEDNAIKLDISVDLVSASGVVMYYTAEVIAEGQQAEWNGSATIFYANTYFRQDCYSLCDSTGSCKFWRDKWVKSYNISPGICFQEWLADAEHMGSFLTRPVSPAAYADALASCVDAAYRVTFPNSEIPWNAFCDAYPDSFFGGASLLQQFDKADITLFFGIEDLVLDAILIQNNDPEHWLSIAILPSCSEESPDADLSKLDISVGVLSEEWTILQAEEVNKPRPPFA